MSSFNYNPMSSMRKSRKAIAEEIFNFVDFFEGQ